MRRFGRRRKYDPLRDLYLNIRVAACQIESPQARRIAAREADRIPITIVEKAHGKRGQLAKLARKIMRELPQSLPEERAEIATTLRGIAEAINSRFEVTSEIELGRKSRHSGQAA